MAENARSSQAKKTDTSAVDLIRREERRRRRKRNQVFAYLTLILFVILIVAGVVAAVIIIGKKQQVKQPDNNASLAGEINDLVGPEESLEKPEVSDTVPEPTPEEKLDKIIDAAIEVMPLEDKVAGLFIVTPESITGAGTAIQAGEGTKDALNKWAVGGLIYFQKNIKSAEQLKEMISNTLLYSKYPLFIAVDEEG